MFPSFKPRLFLEAFGGLMGIIAFILSIASYYKLSIYTCLYFQILIPLFLLPYLAFFFIRESFQEEDLDQENIQRQSPIFIFSCIFIYVFNNVWLTLNIFNLTTDIWICFFCLLVIWYIFPSITLKVCAKILTKK